MPRPPIGGEDHAQEAEALPVAVAAAAGATSTARGGEGEALLLMLPLLLSSGPPFSSSPSATMATFSSSWLGGRGGGGGGGADGGGSKGGAAAGSSSCGGCRSICYVVFSCGIIWKGSVSGAMSDGTICPACVCLAKAWLDDRVGMFGRREEGDEQLDACRRLMFRRACVVFVPAMGGGL